MTKTRKSAEAREKDLRLAIFRIERGRAHTKSTTLSVSSVAREAGVSAALIYNHYPAVAEEIRVAIGRSARGQRDAKQVSLLAERQRNRELRAELQTLKDQMAKLASINEMLLDEARGLRAIQADPKVSVLPQKVPEKR